MNNNFAILILSCDRYADLWPVALKQFRKHFEQNSYKIYFGSNTRKCEDPDVIPLLSGEDRDWSSSYLAILEKIPEKKLFVLLEDLLAVSTIDSSRFAACVEFLVHNNANHIKYWPNPNPDRSSDNPEFKIYDRGAPYRATVCGFWDREYLISLLLEGESPWDFEIMGSYRTSYVDGFYGLNKPLFEFKNLIEKGCWIPQSLEWAEKEGIELDLNKRPILQGRRQLVSRIKMAYFSLMIRVPWRSRVKWMNVLRRALISY